MKKYSLLIILLIGGILGFYLGHQSEKESVENYTNHTDIIREIAELSTLEVKGIASLTQTNVTDGSIWNSISNYSGEKTIMLNIPYTAKFGCKLADTNVLVKDLGDNKVNITLKNPELLSYEMRLDNMRQLSKNGLFVLSQDDKFAKPQKKLYKETRIKLMQNKEHIASAKTKIEAVLSRLLKANGLKTSFTWED